MTTQVCIPPCFVPVPVCLVLIPPTGTGMSHTTTVGHLPTATSRRLRAEVVCKKHTSAPVLDWLLTRRVFFCVHLLKRLFALDLLPY